MTASLAGPPRRGRGQSDTEADRSWRVVDIPTPVGLARVHLDPPTAGSPTAGSATAVVPTGGATGTLVLGHGAGGGVAAPDLMVARQVAMASGWAVARVEQPWRVAGRRVAAPPARLDMAWAAVLASPQVVRFVESSTGPLVVGGRSAGARVACRMAELPPAAAVLALAFPLHPPGRPDRSRAAELAAALGSGRSVVVVQGDRDPFGTPQEVTAAVPGVLVRPVPGAHALDADLAAVGRAVRQVLHCVPLT
ncbi:MAG: alpha/beta family hydrolase [Angustibacter sp.]